MHFFSESCIRAEFVQNAHCLCVGVKNFISKSHLDGLLCCHPSLFFHEPANVILVSLRLLGVDTSDLVADVFEQFSVTQKRIAIALSAAAGFVNHDLAITGNFHFVSRHSNDASHGCCQSVDPCRHVDSSLAKFLHLVEDAVSFEHASSARVDLHLQSIDCIVSTSHDLTECVGILHRLHAVDFRNIVDQLIHAELVHMVIQLYLCRLVFDFDHRVLSFELLCFVIRPCLPRVAAPERPCDSPG